MNGKATLMVAMGDGTNKFESECQLLSGLVTMRVIDKVLQTSKENGLFSHKDNVDIDAYSRLKELWMGNLRNHGGIVLTSSSSPLQFPGESSSGETLLQPCILNTSSEEANQIRNRSKYINMPTPVQPIGNIHGCKGHPQPYFRLPQANIALPNRTESGSIVRESFALRCVVDLTDAPSDKRADCIAPASRTAVKKGKKEMTKVVHAEDDDITINRWAEVLGYPFHGLLLEHRDKVEPIWHRCRVSQFVFDHESGLLSAVRVRYADGHEQQVNWPSRDIRCVVCPERPSSDIQSIDVTIKSRIHEEMDLNSEPVRSCNRMLKDDGQGDLAQQLGISELDDLNLEALSSSNRIVISEKSGSKNSSLYSKHPLTPALLSGPLLHLLPHSWQRTSLIARMEEAERYFKGFDSAYSQFKPKFQPIQSDGTIIPEDAGIVGFGGEFLGKKSLVGVTLDPREDPSVEMCEPQCTMWCLDSSGAGFTQKKRNWNGSFKDVYLVTQGVSSILPQCRIKLDTNQIVDSTLEIPMNVDNM